MSPLKPMLTSWALVAFVKEFLDKWLTQIILVALALLGGGKPLCRPPCAPINTDIPALRRQVLMRDYNAS